MGTLWSFLTFMEDMVFTCLLLLRALVGRFRPATIWLIAFTFALGLTTAAAIPFDKGTSRAWPLFMLLGFAFAAFRASIAQRFLWASICVTAIVLAEQCTTLTAGVLGWLENLEQHPWLPDFAIVLLQGGFLAAIAWILLHFMPSGPQVQTAPLQSPLAVIGCTEAWLLCSHAPLEAEMQRSTCLPAYIGLAVLSIATAMIACRLGAYYESHKRLALDMQRARHEAERLREHHDFLRRWQHDEMHHLKALAALAADMDLQGVKKYIGELLGDFAQTEPSASTGNVYLDMLVADTAARCRVKGVSFHSHVENGIRLQLTGPALNTFLGNALSNAAEAADHGGFVELQIVAQDLMTKITITNSADGRYRRTGSTFLSTKGEGRGYGLGQMDRAVQAAGGFMHIRSGQQIFRVDAWIPSDGGDNAD